MRICSLFPAATEWLYALGLGGDIVGVSHECVFPAEAQTKPRVIRTGIDQENQSSLSINQIVQTAISRRQSLYAVDVELLSSLKPDVIITQSLCHVCAIDDQGLGEALGAIKPAPAVISLHAHTLEDIFREVRMLGHALNKNVQARELAAGLTKRIESVQRATAAVAAHPRVFCLEWMNPLMAAGHWVPEMVALASGAEVLGKAGAASRFISWEEVAESAPQVLLLMPCGFPIERTLKEMAILTENPYWSRLPAVQNQQVWLVDGPSYFNAPGPRVVGGIELLARLFHPGSFVDTLAEGRALRYNSRT